jgi:hypothetical protein
MAERDPHEPKRFTGGRTERRKDRRRLKAGGILARADWLDDPLVFWTGQPRGDRGAAARDAAPVPDFLPRLVETHLQTAPPGLYAVKVGRGGEEQPPLTLTVLAARRIDQALLADASRALSAARRFPRAIGRRVGALDTWRARADGHAQAARRCLDAAEHPTATSAIALEEEAVWLGKASPPSRAQPTQAFIDVVSSHPEPRQAGSRMAAVVLGMRGHEAAVPKPLLAWRSLGARLRTWSAPNVVALGSVLGVDRALSLVSRAPRLNDSLQQAPVHECRLGHGILRLQSTRELLALLEEGKALTPWQIELRRRSLSLALRFRALGVPARPRTLATWMETVGPEEAFVRPARAGSAERWCAALHESLVAFGDRLQREHASLDPLRVGFFRAWARHAAPLGPEAVGIVLDCKPWRACGPADADSWSSGPPSQAVVERAVRWLADLRKARRAGSPNASGAGPPTEAGLPLANAAFAMRNVRDRETVLEIGARLARLGSVPWATLTSLLDELSLRVDWRRLSASLARPAAEGWIGPVTGLLARTHASGSTGVDESAIEAVGFALLWCEHGFAVDDRLLVLLTSPEGAELRSFIQSCDMEAIDLALRVSDGSISRLRNVLVLGQQPRRHSWPLLPAWTLLERHSNLRSGVRACFDRPELVARAMRMLDRLALAVRLSPGTSLGRRVGRLEAGEREVELPGFVSSDAARSLRRLAHLSAGSGAVDSLPRSLRRILHSHEAMLNERRALRLRARTHGLDESQRARLDKVERVGQEPAVVQEQVARQLARAIPKHLSLATLGALEAAARAEMSEHWKVVLAAPGGQVPETPDWDNALAMVRSVRHNRRILTQLLRHEVSGDRPWARGLPANQAFLESLSEHGLDAQAWLSPRSRPLPTPAGRLLAYVADDPLEVLQMGNLFGTCLSADGSNAHAAVAAAVEVNKRVLYLRDARGRVQGRRLLALTREGELLGFHSYGSGEEAEALNAAAGPGTGRDAPAMPDVRPWVKLAFDLLSLDLARGSSARLRRFSKTSAGGLYLTDEEDRSLQLSCQGYFDHVEPFDWWIERLSLEQSPKGDRDQLLVRQWLTAAPPESAAGGENRSWETCRAFLWLGSHAPPLTRDRVGTLGLGSAQLATLARHSSSARLRREAREGMAIR